MCTCSINWSSVSVPSWLEQMRQSPKALMTVVLLMCEAPLCLWDKPSLSLPLGTTTLFPHFRWKKVKSLQRVILARVTLLIFLQLGLGPNLSDFRLWMFFPPASVPPWWYRMARLVVPHQGKGDTAPFPDPELAEPHILIFRVSPSICKMFARQILMGSCLWEPRGAPVTLALSLSGLCSGMRSRLLGGACSGKQESLFPNPVLLLHLQY